MKAEAPYPDVAGAAAIDGTGSHLLLELCLEQQVNAEHFLQQVIGQGHHDSPMGWLVDEERCHRVQACLNYVSARVHDIEKQYRRATVIVESESKSNAGKIFGRTDWYGTCDVTITAWTGLGGDDVKMHFIETIDFKDGRGWVNVKDNTQLLSYLFGKMAPYKPECRMTVVQPKTTPPVRYQCSLRADDDFSAEYVYQKAGELNAAANRTDMPDAPRKAGSWCQWCKASPKRGGNCTTKTDESLEVLQSMNTSPEVTGDLMDQVKAVVANPKSMSNDQLSQLLSTKEPLMAAYDACAAEIQARIEAGQEVDGYEMRAGNSKRVWAVSEEEVAKALKGRRLKKDQIYPAKLITPAQAVKHPDLTEAQRKKLAEDLTSVVAGALTLQKVAHKNKLSVDEMFNKPTTDTTPVSFL